MEEQKPPKEFDFRKLRAFMRDPSIIPSAKCVFVDLLLHAGTDRDAFPSQSTLARNLGLKDERQIRNLLKILKDKGCLVGWKKRGYSQSNKYVINPEFYYRNENTHRNYVSPVSGNKFPVQTGTVFPPKGVIKESQLTGVESSRTGVLSPNEQKARISKIQDLLAEKTGAM